MYIRYYDSGDIFASIVLFLVIAAIIAVLTIYVGLIVLFIFLGIGLLIALAYALYVYIKNLVAAVKGRPSIGSHGPLVNATLSWLWVLKTASLSALKENFSIAHSALLKASTYSFRSFKKWMWLIVAPAVIVAGTVLIIALALFQFGLFGTLVFTIVSIILAFIAVFLICFIPLSFYLLFKSILTGCSVSNIFTYDFTKSATYGQLGTSCGDYYKGMGTISKVLWQDCFGEMSSNFGNVSTYAIFNPLKYFYLSSPVSLFLVCVIYTVLIAVFGVLGFLFIALAALVWTTIVKIFVH